MPEYQNRLSDDYLVIGRLKSIEEPFSPLGEQMFAKALELQEDLVKRFPDSCEFHSNLSNTYKNIATSIDERLLPNSPFDWGMVGVGTGFGESSMAQLICGPPARLRRRLFTWHACSPTRLSFPKACAWTQSSRWQARELARRAVEEMKRALEIEPRREDYLPVLHRELLDLANADIRLRDHASVAKIAFELAASHPNDPTTRMESAEYLAWALRLVQANTHLAKESAQELEKRYSDAAVVNLEAAGRLDAAYTVQKLLDPKAAVWKPLLQQPAFKNVMDKLKEALKPNGA